MLRHKQYHFHKIMRRHRDMMNKGTFTRNVAAYEYMKRNIYFVKMSYSYLDRIDHGNYSQREWLKLIQQVFLYSGVDLREKIDDQHYINPRKKQFNDFLEYDDLNVKAHLVDKRYWYSQLYETEEEEKYTSYASSLYEFESNRDYATSSFDNKKMFPINLDIFSTTKNEERLLKHLVPSICIQFNPSMPNPKIIESLKHLLSQLPEMNWESESKDSYPNDGGEEIALPYTQFSSPEILINEEGVLDYKYIPMSFKEKASHIALIMYDIVKLFKINDVDEIQNIINKYFATAAYSENFLVYFENKGSSNDYIMTIKESFLNRKINDVSTLINQDFLKLIYTQEVIDVHAALMKKMYFKNVDHNEESFILEVDKIKKNIINNEVIEYDQFLGIVQLSDLNRDDFDAMNKTYPALKIFETILL